VCHWIAHLSETCALEGSGLSAADVLTLDCWSSSTRVGVWSVLRPAVQTS